MRRQRIVDPLLRKAAEKAIAEVLKMGEEGGEGGELFSLMCDALGLMVAARFTLRERERATRKMHAVYRAHQFAVASVLLQEAAANCKRGMRNDQIVPVIETVMLRAGRPLKALGVTRRDLNQLVLAPLLLRARAAFIKASSLPTPTINDLRRFQRHLAQARARPEDIGVSQDALAELRARIKAARAA